MAIVLQEQSVNKMDTDPDSAHTERQIPQSLNPGILLESTCPTESTPPYNQCIQIQLTPYSYYGDETRRSGENQIHTDAFTSNKEQFDDT